MVLDTQQISMLKYKKVLIKLHSNSSRQSKSSDWSNQIITIYLIEQFKPVK